MGKKVRKKKAPQKPKRKVDLNAFTYFVHGGLLPWDKPVTVTHEF